MVTERDIQAIARLMRIEIDAGQEHVRDVTRILEYFDILDSAEVRDQGIDARDMPLEDLRADEHIPYEGNLINRLKNHKGGYVRAPRMS